jgi:hypothetical protein
LVQDAVTRFVNTVHEASKELTGLSINLDVINTATDKGVVHWVGVNQRRVTLITAVHLIDPKTAFIGLPI